MTNIEKYNEIFIRTFEVSKDQLPSLKYHDIAAWDSVGHMGLITEIESTFGILLDSEDIIDFDSYEKGKEILSKNIYGVEM